MVALLIYTSACVYFDTGVVYCLSLFLSACMTRDVFVMNAE
jgi:hypothetical protein